MNNPILISPEEREHLREYAKRERARRDLLYFTTYTKENYITKYFHKEICSELQDFMESEINNKLMIFMPPQTGKSEISSRRFPAWVLGKYPDLKIALTNYNATIAAKFNKDIQKIMDDEKYMKIFPNTKLQGMSASKKNSTHLVRNTTEFEIANKEGSLITVGVGGALTSRQVDLLILDDLYKDAMAAWSPVYRQNVLDWYDAVGDARLHNQSKIIIVFTRWHEEDLAGVLLEREPKEWKVISYPALAVENEAHRKIGDALWPERHSKEKMLKIKKNNLIIFESLYQQDPKPKEGLLYNDLKEYGHDDLPEEGERLSMTDVADAGTDFYCSIFYNLHAGYAYITDVIYTDDSNKKTIPLQAKKIIEHKPKESKFESNNAGGVFADQVDKILEEKNHIITAVTKFHQKENKEARILNNATIVQDRILFPKGWNVKYPAFHYAVTRFMKLFRKNKHDDAPDTLTMIAENINKVLSVEIFKDLNKELNTEEYDDEEDDV